MRWSAVGFMIIILKLTEVDYAYFMVLWTIVEPVVGDKARTINQGIISLHMLVSLTTPPPSIFIYKL